MPDETDGVGRRRFISGAAVGAAGFIAGPGAVTAANALPAGAQPAAGTAAPHSHSEEHQTVPADVALRVKALESLLVEKGMVKPEQLDEIVQTYKHNIGPQNGARVVARAWVDPAYRQRLMADATAAIAELGFSGAQGEHMVAVEQTAKVHNLVVCTLCSCYPWPTLGLPPAWYKSSGYRSRAVIDPRGVLREFGVDVDPDIEVRVWDSTAELRYLVLPQRPAGTETLSEAELAALVTRDSMIGTGILPAAEAKR
jgi:nitrile hydratase subunit alpha